MNDVPSPFVRRPGCDGVVVALSDKRWYLRQWHAHDTLEINLVLRGSGQVLLENRRYPLLPGQLIWLWPGQRHVPSDWSSDMRLWIVEWQPAALKRLLRARRRDEPAPADPARTFCRRLAPPALQRLDGLLAAVTARDRPFTITERPRQFGVTERPVHVAVTQRHRFVGVAPRSRAVAITERAPQ